MGGCLGGNRKPAEQRFWEKVSRTVSRKGCWVWLGWRHAHGYGEFKAGDRKMLAHRYSWELHNGAIPDDMHVLHKCDNPPCVRPSHLFLGTQAANVADMTKKGRQRNHGGLRGAANPRAKLTWHQVAQIRRRYAVGGITQAALAQHYKVSPAMISMIVTQKNWKD